MDNQLFRKKSIDRISSPEELHDYMRVTSPRLWMILGAIIVLLAGFIIYAATTRMESTEKVVFHVEDNLSGYVQIPTGRENLIKVGMQVRIGGHTGRITSIDNTMEQILKVSFDGDVPTDASNYIISAGEDRDVQLDVELYSENNEEGKEFLQVFQEDGLYYVIKTNSIPPVFMQSDVRVRFWTTDYSEGGMHPTLAGGRLGTINSIQSVVVSRAFIELDPSEEPISCGLHEGEIVTETTTPISFLLN